MNAHIRPNTTFLLMAQYNGAAMIPVERLCEDYFSHLSPEKLIRKVDAGQIALPLVRIEESSKCARGVMLSDLADYLDARAEEARRVNEKLCGANV
jgi:hypothetical protein